MPEEILTAQKDAAPDPLSESFAGLILGVANGSEVDMKNARNVFSI